MSKIGIVRASSIGPALQDNRRQYLAGTLQRPQDLVHIPDSDIEVGVAAYEEAAADVPHFHPVVSEYQYVISGRCLLLDVDTDEVHDLEAGDFYAIPAGKTHVQKCTAGTKIIFFKHPAVDDKVTVELSSQRQSWLTDLVF